MSIPSDSREKIIQETLEQCYSAIGDAIYNDDGLDGVQGRELMDQIVDVLGYNPGPKVCGACQKPYEECKGH